MFVKDYMTRHPIMVAPKTLAANAQQIMIENQVRHLPVVGDGKRLQGLITRSRLSVPPSDLASLNVWEISRILSELKVQDVMIPKKSLITISEDETLEAAAKTMMENKIGSLVVVEEDIVIGIISEIDLLSELNNLLGGDVKGIRVTIRIPDETGEFAKISNAIASKGWGIYASGGVPSPKKEGYWDVVIKVRNVPEKDLVAALSEVEGHEIIDSRETC